MQYLLEGFIVDKASGILGNLELPLLYLLAKLPATGSGYDGFLFQVEGRQDQILEQWSLWGAHLHVDVRKTAASYTLNLDSVSERRWRSARDGMRVNADGQGVFCRVPSLH